MRLDQGLQPEFERVLVKCGKLVFAADVGRDEQYGAGAHGVRVADAVPRREEVLAQHGQAERRNTFKHVGRAAVTRALRDDGDGARARRLEARGVVFRAARAEQRPLAGGTTLNIGNHREQAGRFLAEDGL